MRALVKLFGRSPFAPLRTHMDKVAACVEGLDELFDAFFEGNSQEIETLSAHISKLEHEADLAKNDIRGSLKSHLFLPVDRVRLLEVLGIQDDLADKAEDIGILLTFRTLVVPEEIRTPFKEFLKKNLETFEAVFQVIDELNELIESSFGGVEAEKMVTLVDHVAYLEHKVDVVQRELIKTLYRLESKLSYAEFHLWMRLIEGVGDLSNLSEKLANRVLMTMELK